MRSKWLSIASVALSVVFVAAACTTGGTNTPSASASASSAFIGEITIASELPAKVGKTIRFGSGGKAVQNGVEFAMSQTPSYKNIKFNWTAFDHTVAGAAAAAKATDNVTIATSDQRIVAIVGPVNGNVARSVIPVANKAGIAMISPQTTSECLSLSLDYCNPKASALKVERNNFFQTPGNNVAQSKAIAELMKTLKVTKVAVFTDKDATFSLPVTEGFIKAFTAAGGTITNRQDYDKMAEVKDFTPFLNAAKAAGAQAIFDGAQSATANGCVVRAQMKGIFDAATVPFVTYDLGADDKCIKDAGDQASNMFWTNGIADVEQNPEAAATVAAFKKAFPGPDDYTIYSMLAYDATNIVIDAVKRAIDANGGKVPTRFQVLDAMTTTNFKGTAPTTYSFDANGDVKAPVFSVYGIKNGAWAFVSQSAIK